MAYAQRLRDAGVAVDCLRLDGLIHAAIHMLGLTPGAGQLFEHAGQAMKNQA